MDETDSFCVSSSSFSSRLLETVKDVFREDRFSDVTLVSDDLREIRAHRLVLTSGSRVLKRILSRISSDHPVIYLRGVDHDDLESVMQFLYYGDVTVAQDKMSDVLSVARDLQVYQLSGLENTGGNDTKHESKLPQPVNKPSPKTKNKLKRIKITQSRSRPDDDANTKLETLPVEVTRTTEDISDPTEDPLVEYNNDLEDDNIEAHYDDSVVENVDVEMNTSEQDISVSNTENLTWEQETDILNDSMKPKPVKCRYCGQSFSAYASRIRHEQAEHLKKRYPCDQCSYQAKYKQDLTKHILSVHDKVRYKCPHCDHEATNESNLRSHMNRHKGIKYPCKFCDYEFNSSSNLKRHLGTAHKDRLSDTS